MPEKTLFVITTDGMENASRRYTSDQVKKMIEKEKNKYGWEFLFIGANIDAVETGARFGIGRDRVANYVSDSQGTGILYESVGAAVSQVRGCAPISADWNRRMENDNEKRGKRR